MPALGVRTGLSLRRSMPVAAWYVFCTALALLFLYPIAAMLFQALKTPAEAAAVPPGFLPHQWSLDNFVALAGGGTLNVIQSFWISVLVSVGTMVFTTLLATFGAYGLSRLRFPGSNAIFFVILLTFMIPFQAIITPLYLVLNKVGLTNSLLGLVLVIGTFHLPFGLFVMRNAFSAVPMALEEAAFIDGCGVLANLFRIALPLALPGMVTTALFGFFAAWNEFFAPLILLSDQNKYTLTVLLSILQTGQEGALNWGVMEAGVVLTTAPCIVIFILLQRYYVSGLVTGAVK
jgi:multiple sugar transport system permease protein